MLATWMATLAPLLTNVTLLDLSLPGAHDAMTYDLSDTLSDGYEGMGKFVSSILHTVTPVVAGNFIRAQGQTQGTDVIGMLDGGVRFIDFRVMYTEAPDTVLHSKDWYCLHGTETKHTAITYLKEIRDWLGAHPKEIVVLWVSRHGDTKATGTDQYPDTTPAQRQSFFHEAAGIFGTLMFNASSGGLNVTTIGRMWERGQRVVWYASDYAQSTASSTLALDASKIDNQLAGALYDEPSGSKKQADTFAAAPATRAADKAADRFFLLSMASSAGSKLVEYQALQWFLGHLFFSTSKCVKELHIPDMKGWCPPTLMDLSLLANYYSQRTIEAAYEDDDSDFPHAIYIDGIDTDGTIRTGTSPINPLSSSRRLATQSADHATTAYAYAATLVGANLKRLCKDPSTGATCAPLKDLVEAERAKYPTQRWQDEKYGRLSAWPSEQR